MRQAIINVSLAAALCSACATTSGARSGDDDEQSTAAVQDYHRHRNQGVTEFIIMGLDGIGDEDEVKGKQIDKLQDELIACQKPAAEANRALLSVLAEGAESGTIDQAKADAQIDRIAMAANDARNCSVAVLDALHATLNAGERSALADKIEANWAVWREQNEAAKAGQKSGRLNRLAEKLALTSQQLDTASKQLEVALADLPRRFDADRVSAQVEAFGDAFSAETFDSKSVADTLGVEIAAPGAARTARFYETVVPLLTAEQRTKLAGDLKDRANEQPST